MDSTKAITAALLNVDAHDPEVIEGFLRAFRLGYREGRYDPRLQLDTPPTVVSGSRGSCPTIDYKPDPPRYVGLEDMNFTGELVSTFSSLREESRSFFGTVQRTGMVDFSLLNKWFIEAQSIRCLSLAGSIYSPVVIVPDMPIPYNCIQIEIYVKVYIAPFLSGKAEFWKRIRQCEECGCYFFYKLERAKYCTTACRMRAHNKARRNLNQEELMQNAP